MRSATALSRGGTREDVFFVTVKGADAAAAKPPSTLASTGFASPVKRKKNPIVPANANITGSRANLRDLNVIPCGKFASSSTQLGYGYALSTFFIATRFERFYVRVV
jgi:hypothetical protein